MIKKNPIISHRIRKINSSFAWIPHSFLRKGFWASLSHHELLLYLFLALVADRHGLSYYSFDRICSLLDIRTDEYILARNGLIDKDLIAFDGYLYQVLTLPEIVASRQSSPLENKDEMRLRDPATISRIIGKALGGDCR